MEKSDDYIDYKAYARYLRKVTGAQADLDRIKDSVLRQTEEKTEMQTAYQLLKGVCIAAASVVIVAAVAALAGLAGYEEMPEAGMDLWSESRVPHGKKDKAVRLYEAYLFSNGINENL